MILGHHGPAIIQEPHVTLAGVDHGLDGECHAGGQFEAGSRFAIMQDLGVFMVYPADAVSTVFTHHGKMVALGEYLDGVADVAQPRARFDLADAVPHGLMADLGQTPCRDGRGAHEVHAARIAVETVADDGNVDIDDVAGLQLAVAGDAVADHVIDRGTDRLREAAVVQIGGDGLELLDDEVMAALVEFVGGGAGLDEGFDHVEHAGREAPGDAHLLLFSRRFDGHIHT